ASVESATWQGTWSVIQLWSARCGACVRELPTFPDLAATAEKGGARFVGVNIDEDTTRALELGKTLGSRIPAWRAEGGAGLLVNPEEPLVPATIVVGKDGK